MFDNLTSKLSAVFQNLTGKNKIDQKDLQTALKKIKEALIEADVSLSAIEKLTKKIEAEMLGHKVLKKLSAFDMIVKACNDAFVEILSSPEGDSELKLPKKPSFLLMLGLQGSGKTTTCAKLALKLKKEGKKVLLVSLDVHRFAAQKQLQILAEENGINSLEIIETENPLQILKRVKVEAKNFDVVILDSAGRLQIDDSMMNEIIEIKVAIHPDETILTLDAMMGQDAANVARAFHEKMHVTGLIFTKMDSDTRGGAIISVKAAINRPIKFLGVGEKSTDLEKFHAERIAGRILDMGDIITMVEQAQENLKQEEVEGMMKRFQEGNFDLHDFYKQMKMVGKMGGMSKIMGFLPGMGGLKEAMQQNTNDSILKKNVIIMDSMTKQEKSFPNLLEQPKRQKRIAKGAGASIHELQKLLQQFHKLQKTMAKMKKMSQSMGGGMPNFGDLSKMKLDDLKNMDMDKLKKMLGQ